MLAKSKQMNKVDSQLLAEYILFKSGPMSHLKLQKLLYYADALHLAYFDQPLIDDDFEAWVHGPVSRKIFDTVRDLSILYDNISYVKDSDPATPDVLLKEQLTEDQLELIDEVLEEYGKLSQYQLETLSHSEYPWQNARRGYAFADRCSKIIDKQITKEFYKSQLYEQENKT